SCFSVSCRRRCLIEPMTMSLPTIEFQSGLRKVTSGIAVSWGCVKTKEQETCSRRLNLNGTNKTKCTNGGRSIEKGLQKSQPLPFGLLLLFWASGCELVTSAKS